MCWFSAKQVLHSPRIGAPQGTALAGSFSWWEDPKDHRVHKGSIIGKNMQESWCPAVQGKDPGQGMDGDQHVMQLLLQDGAPWLCGKPFNHRYIYHMVG